MKYFCILKNNTTNAEEILGGEYDEDENILEKTNDELLEKFYEELNKSEIDITYKLDFLEESDIKNNMDIVFKEEFDDYNNDVVDFVYHLMDLDEEHDFTVDNEKVITGEINDIIDVVEKSLEKCNIYNSIKKEINKSYITAIEEAISYNLFEEIQGLENLLKMDLKSEDRLYKQARYNLIKFILNKIEKEPYNGEYYDEENNKLVKEAGKNLAKINCMRDKLVWAFIPDRFKREIDVLWDGIGGWLS